MNLFQHVCYPHAGVPLIRSEHSGVLHVHVPWARTSSGFTLLFEALVMSMEPQMPVAAIARQVRESDTRPCRILDHHVGRAREREDFAGVTAIAIDETSRRLGHRYVSVVADVKKRRMLFATERKGQNVIERFAADFEAHGGTAHTIKHVSMDMSPAFVAGVAESLPDAEITFDRSPSAYLFLFSDPHRIAAWMADLTSVCRFPCSVPAPERFSRHFHAACQWKRTQAPSHLVPGQ